MRGIVGLRLAVDLIATSVGLLVLVLLAAVFRRVSFDAPMVSGRGEA